MRLETDVLGMSGRIILETRGLISDCEVGKREGSNWIFDTSSTHASFFESPSPHFGRRKTTLPQCGMVFFLGVNNYKLCEIHITEE